MLMNRRVIEYRYIGDRITDAILKGSKCKAVRRADGKCIRGANGSMLVEFTDLRLRAVVIGRLLRKL
jgi:hypothetical protein